MSSVDFAAKAVRVGVLSALLLLAACGDGGSDESSELSPEDSPIGRALGMDLTDSEAMQEQFAEQERLAQEKVVQCMADAGFEYIPDDQSSTFVDPTAELRNLSAREFAEQYGWGAATLMDAYDSFGSNYVDPNQEYVESLSPETQSAYYETLYGSGPEFEGDPETMTEEEMQAAFDSYEPTGCQEIAFQEVFEEGDSAFGIFDEIGEQYNELFERFLADPRIVEFNREWAACIGEAGYSYASTDEAQEAVYQRVNELYESASFAGAGLTEQQMQEMSEAELEELFSKPPQFDEELRAEIEAEEIAFAIASLDCGFPPPIIGEPQVYLEVRFELEQQFVDDNQELFDRYAQNQG